MSFSTKAFLVAVCSAAIGCIMFLIGLAAVFRRAGNWSNHLALAGIILLTIGALSNLVAFIAGFCSMVKKPTIDWWWFISALGFIGTLYAGWMVLNL